MAVETNKKLKSRVGGFKKVAWREFLKSNGLGNLEENIGLEVKYRRWNWLSHVWRLRKNRHPLEILSLAPSGIRSKDTDGLWRKRWKALERSSVSYCVYPKTGPTKWLVLAGLPYTRQGAQRIEVVGATFNEHKIHELKKKKNLVIKDKQEIYHGMRIWWPNYQPGPCRIQGKPDISYSLTQTSNFPQTHDKCIWVTDLIKAMAHIALYVSGLLYIQVNVATPRRVKYVGRVHGRQTHVQLSSHKKGRVCSYSDHPGYWKKNEMKFFSWVFSSLFRF